MPELRKDPVVDRWVIIAPERADRPNALLRWTPERDDGSCPFCPGHESMTPPELLSQHLGEEGWTLRVVPNRYPALRTEIQMSRAGHGLYDSMAGVGAHEVVIETREHALTFADFKPAQMANVLRAWQERMVDLSRDIRLKTIIAFKNHGTPAGATLFHAHSQLVALPFVPATVGEELRGAQKHFEEKERCLYCDMLGQELREEERIVLHNEGAVAFAPWASRSPFETWILPRAHGSSFEAASMTELEAVAEALRALVRKLDVALEKPASTSTCTPCRCASRATTSTTGIWK
jgi:UDPglucose--hexose-1-phosphate uridylyltransferase